MSKLHHFYPHAHAFYTDGPKVAILEHFVPIGSVQALPFLLHSVLLIGQNFLKPSYLFGTLFPQVTYILSFCSQATLG
jgi:hypothetical protein